MATERPRNIMRNATLWLNRTSQIGQASEIGFATKLEQKMQEVFNGGMVTPIEVEMGYEMPENSFKMTGFDPEVLKLFGLAPGVETELMATAATVDDDGTTHSLVAYMRGKIKSVSPDSHKRGELTELEYEFSYRYYKLEIDSQPIIEVTPFDVLIGGVSQTANQRRAMLLG